jgi:hypothetical protein
MIVDDRSVLEADGEERSGGRRPGELASFGDGQRVFTKDLLSASRASSHGHVPGRCRNHHRINVAPREELAESATATQVVVPVWRCLVAHVLAPHRKTSHTARICSRPAAERGAG